MTTIQKHNDLIKTLIVGLKESGAITTPNIERWSVRELKALIAAIKIHISFRGDEDEPHSKT